MRTLVHRTFSLASRQRKGADDGVSILREDQDRINTFARLSARLNDINAEIADKQVRSSASLGLQQRSKSVLFCDDCPHTHTAAADPERR